MFLKQELKKVVNSFISLSENKIYENSIMVESNF